MREEKNDVKLNLRLEPYEILEDNSCYFNNLNQKITAREQSSNLVYGWSLKERIL